MDAVEAAGLEMWPKAFNNLRSSCTTDKERLNWPDTTMNMIFGNSRRVREKNYVQKLREEELADLCGIPALPTEIIHSVKPDCVYDIQGFEPCVPDDPDFWGIVTDTEEPMPSKVSGDFSGFSSVKSIVFAEALSRMDSSFIKFFRDEYGDYATLDDLIELCVTYALPFPYNKNGIASNILRICGYSAENQPDEATKKAPCSGLQKEENGRCKTRTCDPCRVKTVL